MKLRGLQAISKLTILLWIACATSVSTVEPVHDDFEENIASDMPSYYYNEKRSFIYPGYTAEEYPSESVAENVDKRDQIKGPSIDPVIDGTEESDLDREYLEENNAARNFYKLKPENEMTETGSKMSKISHEERKFRRSNHGAKHKISTKEKEAISEGLIKLLYDWKTSKNEEEENGSGMEKGEKNSYKEQANKIDAEKSFTEETALQNEKNGEAKNGLGGKISLAGKNLEEEGQSTTISGSNKELKNTEEEDAETKVENRNAASDSALHDPVIRSKDTGNEVSLGNRAANKDDKPTPGLDDGEEESGDGKESRSKSRGKINVLVNVNINERSLRSKVVHAKAQKRTQEGSGLGESEKEIAKELSIANYDDGEDESGDGEEAAEDEESGIEDSKNISSIVSQPNYKPYQAPVVNNGFQTYSQAPTYATAYQAFPNAVPQVPQAPVAPPAQWMNYQAPQQQASNNSINNNNNYAQQSSYKAVTYQTPQSVPTESKASESEDENSGGDEDFEQESDGAESESGLTESISSRPDSSRPDGAKPAEVQTVQSDQRASQIYFPGSMQTITDTHKTEQKKEEKTEEEESLDEDKEHASNEEEDEDVDRNSAAQVAEYKPMKGPIGKAKKGRKYRKQSHKTYGKKEKGKDWLGTVKVAEVNSKAVKNARKHRKNPKKVTKETKHIRQSHRPSEATKAKAVGKGRNNKETEPEKEKQHSNLSELEDEAGSEDKVHIVKLHDSELRLLKSEKEKLLASEPIVIDDIKKKQEKPKPIPKEATNVNRSARLGMFQKAQEQHLKNDNGVRQKEFNPILVAKIEDAVKEIEEKNRAEIKPTTKRSSVTPSKEANKEHEKPEIVAPPSSKNKDSRDNAKVKDMKGGNNAGSGEGEAKKYGSLKSVRERFKDWEKEMITKLSNPYLKEISSSSSTEGEDDENHGGNQQASVAENKTTAFSSWEDEEKDLIDRLANPYLHQQKKKKFVPKIDQNNTTANATNVSTNETDGKAKTNATKQEPTVNNKDVVVKQTNHTKNLKIKEVVSSAKPPKTKEQLQSELPVDGENEKDKPEEKSKDAKETGAKELGKEEEKEAHGAKATNISKLEELEKFKKQIMSEVDKINKLQNEYKNNMMKSTELEEAKATLTKDLNSIKSIEKKMDEDLKKKKEQKLSKDKSKELKNGDIPNPAEKKENHKEEQKKEDPLAKIQSLLQAEMMRTKKKKKHGKDKQLDNIRRMLKQELSKLISSGKLGSANDLPEGLKNLKTMIHTKLKSVKKNNKKKNKNKKKEKNKNKKKEKKKNNPKKSKDNTNVFGNDLKNSLDLMKEYKPTVAGTAKNMITTISGYKSAMKALDELKKQQMQAGSPPNVTDNSYQPAHTNATTKSPVGNPPEKSPTKPHAVMPGKSPTGAQTEQFKNLLQNLNKKIGEVYSRLQSSNKNGGQQQQQQQQNQQQQNQQQHNNNPQQMNNNIQPNSRQINNNNMQGTNAYQNSNMPGNNPFGNGYNNYAQHQMNYAQPMQPGAMQPGMTEQGNNNMLQAKHETPEPDEDEIDEPEPDSVAAETEAVETLIENLEKDITEVWSYKESFPDAGSLGLDNDKIHQTYANLGSISGLSLRRALDRALRGKDVGLAIVGGSISKGGPFSEKGVEFAVKAYFYAIADWWNKVIRPITGSSMIIRDVSIGGIATDYYSYCLRTHLPNDKLTNIVLWELAANDMRRYDDAIKPRPQALEQFTQNVLSYKAKPALIFVNFFALFAWDKDLLTHCRNFEDEGENDIAKHYKITSLSWRDMVCASMQQNSPLFTRNELFADDQFHPSIEAHAQMAYVIIDYIRTEFLKNLVKQRFLEIGDAARRLKIPDTIYIPKPIYKDTFTWKPVCYTYMMVDNQQPNNTLKLDTQANGDFHYTVFREYKIRSDKIVGMEALKEDQYLTYVIKVPMHPKGDQRPFKKLAIMSFTDDRQAEVRFDNMPVQKIDTAKKFLEGTVVKYVADNVSPGEHRLVIKSGPGGFIVSAVMLG
eukprot:gene17671-19433_t